MDAQKLTYVVAVHGHQVAEVSSGTAGLAAAEVLAQSVAHQLPATFVVDGQEWPNVITVDQMVDGRYAGEASRYLGCSP